MSFATFLCYSHAYHDHRAITTATLPSKGFPLTLKAVSVGCLFRLERNERSRRMSSLYSYALQNPHLDLFICLGRRCFGS